MGPSGAGGFLGGGCRWREGHLRLFSLHDRTYVYGHMYVAICIYMQFVWDCLVARLDFDLGDSIQFNARGSMFCVQNRCLVRASYFPQSPQVCEIHSLYNINKLFYFWHLNSTFHCPVQSGFCTNFQIRTLICNTSQGPWGLLRGSCGSQGGHSLSFLFSCSSCCWNKGEEREVICIFSLNFYFKK